MRRVVGGLLYDTEQATPVYTVEEYFVSPFSPSYDMAETLYLAKHGGWFLYKCCRYQTGDRSWNEYYLKPISAEAARSWLEENGTTEVLLKYFEPA